MENIPVEWLREIVETIDSAVIVIDSERVIRFANERAVQFARRTSKEDLVGARYDLILSESLILNEAGVVASPDNFPSMRVFTEQVPVHDVRFEQIYKGMHRWMSITALPLCEKSGRVTHAIVRFLEISEHKKGEDQLHFLSESIKILSLTSDFRTRLIQKSELMVPSLADWCTLNIVNDDNTLSRVSIIHRDPSRVPLVEELGDRSVVDARAYGGVAQVIATGEAQLHESVDISAGSSPQWRALAEKLQVCSSMIIPIMSRGKVLGILSLAYAESGRHYNQKDLEFMQNFCFHLGVLVDNMRLYEEIQKRDAAKDTFLAALSHELRNPLAPIKSSLELIRLYELGENVQQELEVVEHQFDHLTKLLNDLLDVTRYSRGTIHIEREPADLRSIVRQSAAAARPFLERKRISFEVRLPEGSVGILADQTRLEQAILNILNNAEKFTQEGGRVSLTLAEEDGQARISVSDTGSGMTQEELENLFELGGAGEYKGSGLGLGLLLVKEIMELHEGSVDAFSAGPGQGSTFVLTLPYERSGVELAIQ